MPDVRLKLTVAYVGTGFRGWARQPGERTVEGELRAALDRVYESFERARRRRAHGHRRPRPRPTSCRVDVGGGPPPERAAEALNAVLPADVAVVAAEEAAPGLPRALLGPLALVSLPHLAPARALAVRAAPLALASAPARPRPR